MLELNLTEEQRDRARALAATVDPGIECEMVVRWFNGIEAAEEQINRWGGRRGFPATGKGEGLKPNPPKDQDSLEHMAYRAGYIAGMMTMHPVRGFVRAIDILLVACSDLYRTPMKYSAFTLAVREAVALRNARPQWAPAAMARFADVTAGKQARPLAEYVGEMPSLEDPYA